MMAGNNKLHKQYLHDQILNASPGKLIVLLYDGAIRSLEDAKKQVSDKDPHDYTQNLSKAQNIIAELMGALKKDIFPELVENLARVYDFMFRHLMEAHKDKSTQRIDQVLTLLRNLRGGWAEALENAPQQAQEQDAQQDSTNEVQTPQIKKKPALSFQA